MDEENEYKKLPTEDKCVHKLWKARVAGYEEAIKLFNQIDDEKSPEWNKYLGLIKKFVTDSNAVAQERGLEAALVFVENCGHAGKTTGEVMSGIVAKCIAAPKTKTKDLALQVTLMYVEIEKQDVVQEELMKGMEQKNPKVVAACTAALTTALKQFGNKVVGIKPMVKKIPILLSDRDKGVRDEMKALVVEMHRWIGPAIEPHIGSLQAVLQQELREAFGAVGAAHPTRYLKSQQHKMAEKVARSQDDGDGACDDDEGETGAGDTADVDPYDLLDPVEIISKLPKEFYNKLEEKKWQERKESLDALEAILKSAPRLEPGDYADLVRALKKVISKDSNVMLVALAGRLLGMVASGLRNKFSPYAVACVEAILEKFKEKKSNVVAALRDAIDAIYPSTNLEAIMEDMLNAFNNKNPAVKCESALFLARSLCRTQPAAFNKKLVKAYVGTLVKLLDCAEPAVRDAAAEALGTATKLVGEKNIAPHIDKLDNLKEQKIKEYADKAVIQVKIAAPQKGKLKSTAGKGDGGKTAGSAEPKPVKRPNTAAKKPAGTKKTVSTKSTSSVPREIELGQEEVDAKAEIIFSSDIITGIVDAGNWKTRLAAVQSFYSTIQSLTPDDVNSQVLYRVLNKKPGLKDTNVQVLKARLEASKYITENFPVTPTAANFVIQDIVNKLGEAACTSLSADNLTALAEHCNFEHVVNEGLAFAMDSQKNPKVQTEMFNWISAAIKEFGMTMNIKPLIAHSKKAISATNPNVRTSAVNFIGILSLYTGPSIINHFDGEKAATKQLISLELEKYANNSPPTPTRNVSKSESKASMGDDMDDNFEDAVYDEPAAPVDDNRPKTDIAPLITDSLIGEINDKNWKVRNEALDKLKSIIASSAPIKPTLGELPPALTARLVDSNSKLAQTALQICESLASAMGLKCKQHVRTFFPGFFQALGDNKQWIRQSAVSCVCAWCQAAGGAAVAFEGEMVFEALKTGSPVLRAELYQWLADQLPNAPPKSFAREELSVCVPLLYACLEDRSAEVRKKAADCVLPFMLHLGYESMHKQLDKLKPGSKSVVLAALDKARPNLPVQPLPNKNKKDEPKGVKSGGALKKEEKKIVAPGKSKGIVKPSSASSRGKKDDEDTSPLLPCNNAKNQRIIDDQKLKVLKWNFTTPREEFFDLLKEQMTSAGMNKQLIANMFHADFRYHLKSIEALSEDLLYNGPALMANLDLILKWLTLRFFDTNPSVILKGLEYLSQVFTYLMNSDYTMAEYEANCFIPYLVLKVGDPKDTVRNGVKALFKQICVVYSVTKLFGYLMEGLKSKNARQRAECLECIGVLLETYGSTVMSPSSSSALKELARHIGDRDNAVRSAALNCVANTYFLEGEKVYKMIGQISDKDLSLLEERIKRAGKTRSAETRRSMIIPLSATGKPILQNEPQEMDSRRVISVDIPPGEEYDEEELEDEPPAPAQPAPVEPKVIPGPYGLDPELIARLDAEVPNVRKTNITEVDLKFLDEPIPIPTVRTNIPRPATSVLPMSPPRHINTPSIVSQLTRVNTNLTQHEDTQLADTIHSIASPDIHAAIRALSLVSGALAGGRGMGGGRVNAGGASLEERLLTAVAAQLRYLRSGLHSPADTLHAYKCIASVLSNLYEPGGYGSSVGSAAVSALLSELLRVLGGAVVQDGERLVRILNNICVRMLEHSDRTELLCSLVTLLQESIGVTDPSSPKYQDLLMKCFWKTLKMINSWEVNSVDYDSVLYKIDLFYKAYPNSYWKNSEISDTPNKTVKTLVHSLVKLRGGSITNHLTKIQNVQDSDLYLYLLKVLKQLKLEDKKDPPADNMNGTVLTSVTSNSAVNTRRLSRNVHDELSMILKKIGNKQQNQHALEQLYELRERHPDIDIWTFMQGSSFYFRNFVERGLKDIAEQRRLAPVHALYKPVNMNDSVGEFVDINNENDDTRHLIYLEKLRALQAKIGMKTESPTSQPRTPIDNRALSDSINENTLPKHTTIDPQLQLHSTAPQSHRSEAGMDALRLKLQQIKSSTKR